MKLRRDFIGDMTERVREAYDAKQEMPTVMDRAEQCLTRIVMASGRSEVVTGADAVSTFIKEGFEDCIDEDGAHYWNRKWGMPCGLKHLDMQYSRLPHAEHDAYR